MEKQKIGIIILIVSLLFGIVVFNLIKNSKEAAREDGCFQNAECNTIATVLSFSHLGIGLLFALFSLGAYLIIFTRTEETLLKQLQEQKERLTKEEKLRIINILLSPNEQKVFQTIIDHEGIMQNTLRIKTNLSKATVSQILTDIEKKDVITNEPQGKTYALYLKNFF